MRSRAKFRRRSALNRGRSVLIGAGIASRLFWLLSLRRAAKLFPVGLFERVYFRVDDIFVFERGQDFIPPLVVRRAHLSDDVRMLGKDILFFAGVRLQIIKFRIIDELKA